MIDKVTKHHNVSYQQMHDQPRNTYNNSITECFHDISSSQYVCTYSLSNVSLQLSKTADQIHVYLSHLQYRTIYQAVV